MSAKPAHAGHQGGAQQSKALEDGQFYEHVPSNWKKSIVKQFYKQGHVHQQGAKKDRRQEPVQAMPCAAERECPTQGTASKCD
jgi:hypothetical protein